MKANDTAKLLKLLAEHGEEKIGSAISSLRGLTKSTAPKIEQDMSQLLPAIYEKAPALEGELVGDLATQASKRVLPDVEGQLASQKLITQAENAAPKMITQAEQVAPEVASAAEQALGPMPKKFSMLDGINDLSPTQKAIGGAGLITAASAPLFMNGQQPPLEQPNSPQVLPQANVEEDSIDDGMDTYENPLTAQEKGAPIDASALLNLTKGVQAPEAQVHNAPAANLFDQQLADARQKDAEHQLLFGMLKAGQQGGAAIAGTKSDTSFADTELGKPNEMTNQLKTNMDVREEAANIDEKKQKRDPSSLTSKLYQDMLKEMNPKMNVEGLSAEQVEKVFPQIGMIIGKREAAEARILQTKIHNDTMALAKANKMDEYGAKRLESYRKERDPMLASIRSNLGKEVNRFTQSTHALGLVHGITDLNKITPMQKRELAVALATMVSPGLPHEATIAKLDENTLNDEIAHRLQQMTGKPAATNTKGLAQQLVDSVNNQRKIASKYISDYQSGVDSSYAKDIKQNPEAFSNVSKFQVFNIKDEEPKSDDNKSTTVSKPAQSGLVIVRSKQSGKTKTLTAESAAKYLNDPAFERVQ